MLMMKHDSGEEVALVSLGPTCFAAWLLGRMGSQTGPLPFDWLESDPEMVAECILDDFKELLNPKLWFPLKIHAGVQQHGHQRYSARYKLRVVFAHQNPATPVGFRYYQACIDRFHEVLASGARKIFLLVVDFWRDPERARDSALRKLLSCLETKIEHFSILLIKLARPNGALQWPTSELNATSSALSTYTFTPTSERKNRLTFYNSIDNDAIATLVRSVAISED